MRSKLALLLAALSLSSPVTTNGFQHQATSHRYMVQAASFQDATEAELLVARLTSVGQKATAATVEIPARGKWTRVLVGSFASAAQARTCAEYLMSVGLIREFLIRIEEESSQAPANAIKRKLGSHLASQAANSGSVSRLSTPTAVMGVTFTSHGEGNLPHGTSVRNSPAPSSLPARPQPPRSEPSFVAVRNLPVAPKIKLAFTMRADSLLLPRPDPVRLAFLLIDSQARSSAAANTGGLWLTGNAAEGLARLRWIAGADIAELVTLERDGRVKLDARLLAKAARVSEFPTAEAPLAVTDFIFSNEGLLLLVQLTQSRHRYRLHIARQAPTRGSAVDVPSGINLDDNFDSRINPHRRMGKKLDNERPPEGFDSLVAINPGARWFNQQTNQVVPAGHITFHELAEAHGKLELGLDYLGVGDAPGAHDVALQREQRLKVQRPLSGVVVTAGSNRVLRSEQEAREFFSRLSGLRQ